MPKKHKQKSLLTKPTSSAPPNLSLSRPSVTQDDPTTKTVNDLIRDLRRGVNNERPQGIYTSPSIPPSLRAMFSLPVPPPPVPRPGVRGPTRVRRIPGPAPPKSWLTDSAHAPRQVRSIPWSTETGRGRIQKQCSILPEGAFPPETSLQHLVLRCMATNWVWHAENDHDFLALLPIKLKQTLLSYIAVFNENKGSSLLRQLFPHELEQEECDEVRRLDLGNAIGGWSTIKKIEKELEGDHHQMSANQGRSLLSLNETPDTWEEESITEPNLISASMRSNVMRFRNLKHLSLSVGPGTSGSVASWSALLMLASKLSTLSSLSLAYWPQPTYTPNASTSMVKVKNLGIGSAPPVTYGGSNYYTAFDNDWREAAGILRSLSRSLYCLKWLDLTGCGEWFSALTWKQPLHDDNGNNGEGETEINAVGPDWNGSWRDVEQLILAVGWNPVPLDVNLPSRSEVALQNPNLQRINIPANVGSGSSETLSQLSSLRLNSPRSPDNSHSQPWNVEEERQKWFHHEEIKRHAKILDSARNVARLLRSVRKESGGKWINVDYGAKEEVPSK